MVFHWRVSCWMDLGRDSVVRVLSHNWTLNEVTPKFASHHKFLGTGRSVTWRLNVNAFTVTSLVPVCSQQPPRYVP